MPSITVKKYINKNPKIHAKQAHWSDQQKMQAVTMWLMTGNMTLVSAETGVPRDTIKFWRHQDWWREAVSEVRASANIAVSNRMKKIIDKASDVVIDRLDNGDIQFDPRTGDIKRRPINAKTANDIMRVAIDKDMLLQKLEDKPQLEEDTIVDRLKAIQEQLRKNAKSNKPELPVIDLQLSGPEQSEEPANDHLSVPI